MNATSLTARLALACVCMASLFGHISGASAMRPAATAVESQNEAVVLRFLYEGLNGRSFAVVKEVTAPGFVDHNPFGTTVGLPAFEKVAGTLLTAFPDAHFTVLEVLAAGNTVAVRDVSTATHKGTFLGVPATGKKVSWSEYQFWHLANGKITDVWVTWDTLGLLRQISGSSDRVS